MMVLPAVDKVLGRMLATCELLDLLSWRPGVVVAQVDGPHEAHILVSLA